MAFFGREGEQYVLCEKKDRQKRGRELELTSSVSSPDHGCGSAGPPGGAWCPAAPPSFSGTSSSAAAKSAAHPRYLSADQPSAACKQTHALFYYSSMTAQCISLDLYT